MVKTTTLKTALPTSWEGVTLNQFQRLYRVHKDTSLSQLERDVATISILTDQTKSTIKSIDLGDLQAMSKVIAFTYQLPEQPKVFPTEVQYGGVKFKLVQEASKTTVGELITLESQSKESPDDIIANLHHIIAAFVKPVDPAVDMDFPTRAKLFQEKMSVAVAYPLSVFFCLHWTHSIKVIEVCLANQTKRDLKNLTKTLPKSKRKGLRNSFSGS